MIQIGRTEPRKLVTPATILKADDAVEIKKRDDEQQLVFGEVYAPGYPDSQGDFMTNEGIQAMAYSFLKKGLLTNIDESHNRLPDGAYIVESFIARKGDDTFIPGSWVLGVHIPGADTWDKVKKGELNGFSLDGMGIRVPTKYEVELPDMLRGRTLKSEDHDHTFEVRYDANGAFLGGITGPGGSDMHVHVIKRGTATELTSGHSHRFSFAEGFLNAKPIIGGLEYAA